MLKLSYNHNYLLVVDLHAETKAIKWLLVHVFVAACSSGHMILLAQCWELQKEKHHSLSELMACGVKAAATNVSVKI